MKRNLNNNNGYLKYRFSVPWQYRDKINELTGDSKLFFGKIHYLTENMDLSTPAN